MAINDNFVSLDAEGVNWAGSETVTDESFDLLVSDDFVTIGWFDGQLDFNKKEFFEALISLLWMRKEFDRALAKQEHDRIQDEDKLAGLS